MLDKLRPAVVELFVVPGTFEVDPEVSRSAKELVTKTALTSKYILSPRTAVRVGLSPTKPATVNAPPSPVEVTKYVTPPLGPVAPVEPVGPVTVEGDPVGPVGPVTDAPVGPVGP